VGPEACGYNFRAVFKKKNTKLGTKLNIYFKLEKTLQQITNLKRLKNTTNITKYHKYHKIPQISQNLEKNIIFY